MAVSLSVVHVNRSVLEIYFSKRGKDLVSESMNLVERAALPNLLMRGCLSLV
jgi:hypothetical protein